MSTDELSNEGVMKLLLLEWIPRWPQKIRWIGVLSALLVGFFALLTPVVFLKAVGDGNPVAAVGLTAVGFACALIAVGIVADAGFRNLGLPRRVRGHVDPLYGSGIRIAQRRFVYIILITAIGGIAVYATLAAFSWKRGYGEQLLPAGRDGQSGALYASCIAVVLFVALLLLLLVRNVSTITLHERGVHRSVKRWSFAWVNTVDSFLPWDEIDDVVADEYVVNAGRSAANPIIRLLHHKPELDGQRVGQDREGEMVILAYHMVSEPNALLGLVNFLRENPSDRSVLASPESREMLRPPPLAERFPKSKVS